ncbi:MAG: hypothetical protein IMW89_05355 [Ktedonobacteraceae bacterium]|nr:hypothetical protein [Ktedonobacteraceae bacterium]
MSYNLRANRRWPPRAIISTMLLLLSLLLAGCATGPTGDAQNPLAGASTTGGSGSTPTFPTTPLDLRVPSFGSAGKVAPTVKVLASADPTLIIQFPLEPASIKSKYPNAKGLVTVFQDTRANDFDILVVDVENMPPNVKFTVFLTELSAKPFGHAEYVGDLITDGDGKGEATFHLIAFVAFAADNRHPDVTSQDETGEAASGIQLEHLGLWFDSLSKARQTLGDPTIQGTPFDGGGGPLHAGPQALTDGQTLAVI